MTRLRFALAAFAVALIVLPATTQARPRTTQRVVATKASECVGADLVPTVANLATIRNATLCLLNVERTQRGRLPLRSNGDLGLAANTYARSMVDNSFFGHYSPNGTDFVSRIRRTSYLTRTNGWAVGENLAWGEAELSSPAKTVAAWMASPDHKRNIIDVRYVEIGIGIVPGTPSDSQQIGATYATEFGTRTLIIPA